MVVGRCQKGAMNVHTIPLKGKRTKVLLRFERAPGGAGAASKHGASIVQPYCIAVGSEFFLRSTAITTCLNVADFLTAAAAEVS